MGRRQIRGQGFSLYGLQGEISQAVDILSDALAKQGVEVNQDSLLLQIQNVVKSVGEGYGSVPMSTTSTGYSYLQASDEAPPYSVAGDLLAVGYEQFKLGDKKQGLKNIIAAMGHEDFDDITTGLLAMNAKSVEISADDTDESEEEDDSDVSDDEDSEEEDDSDENDDNEDEDDDLDDDEIDGLLQEDEVTADDGENDDNKDKKDENDEEEEEEQPNTNKLPSKKPMTEEDNSAEKPVALTASQRSIANKLSMNGDKVGRSKSEEFISAITRNRAA